MNKGELSIREAKKLLRQRLEKERSAYRYWDRERLKNRQAITRLACFTMMPDFDPHDIELIAGGGRTLVALLELYHSGTACTEKDNPYNIVPFIQKCVVCGTVFFGAARYTSFPMDPRHALYDGIAAMDVYETSAELVKVGVVPLYDMRPETAWLKLAVLTRTVNDPLELIKKMLNNEAGEISEKLINWEIIDYLMRKYQAIIESR